jgi:hypothetical protein
MSLPGSAHSPLQQTRNLRARREFKAEAKRCVASMTVCGFARLLAAPAVRTCLFIEPVSAAVPPRSLSVPNQDFPLARH